MQYKYFFLARRIQKSFRLMMIRYCGRERSLRLNYDPVDITKFYYYSKIVDMLTFFHGNPISVEACNDRTTRLAGNFLKVVLRKMYLKSRMDKTIGHIILM